MLNVLEKLWKSMKIHENPRNSEKVQFKTAKIVEYVLLFAKAQNYCHTMSCNFKIRSVKKEVHPVFLVTSFHLCPFLPLLFNKESWLFQKIFGCEHLRRYSREWASRSLLNVQGSEFNFHTSILGYNSMAFIKIFKSFAPFFDLRTWEAVCAFCSS